MKINKKFFANIIIVCVVIIGIVDLQFLLTKDKNASSVSEAKYSDNQFDGNVDKIQVVHFHTTQQCPSCIAVGEYVFKTITEKFLEEYESGKIEYLDINVELSENADIVNTFGAIGASLYVNVITEGENNISEDMQVWRLVSKEQSFINYFENKLGEYLK